MYIEPLHAYEVVGEVILRRSGNRTAPLLCKVIRTGAMVLKQQDSVTAVDISVIVTGYDTYHFPKWFRSWAKCENMNGNNPQEGRRIEVAVPLQSYEAMLRHGEPVEGLIDCGSAGRKGHDINLFDSTVAAVRIDGEWVTPLPSRSELLDNRRAVGWFTPST